MIEKFIVQPDHFIELHQRSTNYVEPGLGKPDGKKRMKKNRDAIAALQDQFYAHDRYSMLLVFQALDAAGKDSTVKHVLHKVRPQGIRFRDFMPPSEEELQQDYLWRVHKYTPRRGIINIFHRSYYEDVTASRVHPEFILKQQLPGIHEIADIKDSFWTDRYRQINDFEKMLTENGTIILKFFLHVSIEQQSKRFLKRLRREDKHWKFSEKDIEEQQFREKYLNVYEKAINHTSTALAPWYIIPADRKWYMRYVVSEIILQRMKSLDLAYPGLSLGGDQDIETIRELLSRKIDRDK